MGRLSQAVQVAGGLIRLRHQCGGGDLAQEDGVGCAKAEPLQRCGQRRVGRERADIADAQRQAARLGQRCHRSQCLAGLRLEQEHRQADLPAQEADTRVHVGQGDLRQRVGQ